MICFINLLLTCCFLQHQEVPVVGLLSPLLAAAGYDATAPAVPVAAPAAPAAAPAVPAAALVTAPAAATLLMLMLYHLIIVFIFINT